MDRKPSIAGRPKSAPSPVASRTNASAGDSIESTIGEHAFRNSRNCIASMTKDTCRLDNASPPSRRDAARAHKELARHDSSIGKASRRRVTHCTQIKEDIDSLPLAFERKISPGQESNSSLRSSSSKARSSSRSSSCDLRNVELTEGADSSIPQNMPNDANPTSLSGDRVRRGSIDSSASVASAKSITSSPKRQSPTQVSLMSSENPSSHGNPKIMDSIHSGTTPLPGRPRANSVCSANSYLSTMSNASNATVAETNASAKYIVHVLRNSPEAMALLSCRGMPDRQLIENLALCETPFATLRYECGVDLDTATKVLEELPKALGRDMRDPFSAKEKKLRSRSFCRKAFTVVALTVAASLSALSIFDATKDQRDGWHAGRCALAGFFSGSRSNATGRSQCKTHCSFWVNIQDPNKKRDPTQVFEYDFMYPGWTPTRDYDYRKQRMTWIGTPFRCCDKSQTLNCCDFHDRVHNRFCDNWNMREDEFGEACPIGRWSCQFQVGLNEDSEEVVTAVRLPRALMLVYCVPLAAAILISIGCFWSGYLWYYGRGQSSGGASCNELVDVEKAIGGAISERCSSGVVSSPSKIRPDTPSTVDEPISPYLVEEDSSDDSSRVHGPQENDKCLQPLATALREQAMAVDVVYSDIDTLSPASTNPDQSAAKASVVNPRRSIRASAPPLQHKDKHLPDGTPGRQRAGKTEAGSTKPIRAKRSHKMDSPLQTGTVLHADGEEGAAVKVSNGKRVQRTI